MFTPTVTMPSHSKAIKKSRESGIITLVLKCKQAYWFVHKCVTFLFRQVAYLSSRIRWLAKMTNISTAIYAGWWTTAISAGWWTTTISTGWWTTSGDTLSCCSWNSTCYGTSGTPDWAKISRLTRVTNWRSATDFPPPEKKNGTKKVTSYLFELCTENRSTVLTLEVNSPINIWTSSVFVVILVGS